MKGYEAQRKSYDKQKGQFEAARSKRIQNRNVQKKQIQEKINSLTALLNEIELLNQRDEEKEFESFESFRRKAEEQSREQKKQKSEI